MIIQFYTITFYKMICIRDNMNQNCALGINCSILLCFKQTFKNNVSLLK